MSEKLEPTEAQLDALMKADQTTPVVMVNLLKFRDKAVYEDGRDAGGISGAEAYGLYGQVAQKKIKSVGGSILWQSPREQLVVGTDKDDWDAVVLVRYPSRKAFLEMTSEADYREALPHRTAGLERTALIQCMDTGAVGN